MFGFGSNATLVSRICLKNNMCTPICCICILKIWCSQRCTSCNGVKGKMCIVSTFLNFIINTILCVCVVCFVQSVYLGMSIRIIWTYSEKLGPMFCTDYQELIAPLIFTDLCKDQVTLKCHMMMIISLFSLPKKFAL